MEKRKKGIVYGLIGIVSVLLVILGSSYAFWFISKEQTDKNIVSTDCFQIEFLEGESVVLNNAYPVSDEEGLKNTAYSFKLKNICDSYASYQINLETMMQSGNVKVLPDMYIKAGIQENNKVSVNHKLSSDIEVEKTIDGATKAYQLLTGTLRKNETKEFKLRLWMDYDTPPSDDSMNASYKGKVSIITTYKADQFVKSGTLMIQNENEAFWQKDYRENIKTIVIESVMNPHDTREELIFDVSHNQDKSVMAYLVPDDTDEEKYTLYLQSVGGVKANPNSKDLFKNFINTVEIQGMENFDTSSVTNMYAMFDGMTSLTNLDLSNFDTSNVTNMTFMFQNCKSLTHLDVSSFNTSKVNRMTYLFNEMSSLIELNISSFDTSNVISMGAMFRNCKNLTHLDVSHFNTSQVTNMNQMFEGMSNLTHLDVSNFDTSNVTNMSNMFTSLNQLRELNLNSFNTSNVIYMSNIFSGMENLEKLDISNFDTSKVTTMWGMFANCKSLTRLDLSHFHTGNVEYLVNTFFSMENLEYLDISNFDTHKVVDYFGMFNGNSKLTTIVYGDNFVYTNDARLDVMLEQCPANKPIHESWNGIF